GKSCSGAVDCASAYCLNNACGTPPPTCSDGVKNGTETDVDCGGTSCPKCANGKVCSLATDCSSGNCSAGVCAPPANGCTDGVKDGNETDVDCGGSCAKCQ